ncbi:MAG: polysaccharide deacetylase family protein [Kiritimatiellaeota bacterium]|nr:polysaccharide deacetylase family protein [Kiritimatiellota bacterium]
MMTANVTRGTAGCWWRTYWSQVAIGVLALGPLVVLQACRPVTPAVAPLRFDPSETIREVPVAEKAVALTFDDGPNEPFTSQILEALEEVGAKATFFLIGTNVVYDPESARRIVKAGHTVGIHSFDHPHLNTLSAEAVAREVHMGFDAIYAGTGVRPALFRAPYGKIGPGLADVCREMNCLIIGWSAHGNDWTESMTSEEIAEQIMAKVYPGAILLLHDGNETIHGGNRKQTAGAVRIIGQRLKEQGYRMVTVPELLAMYRPTQFANGVQIRGVTWMPVSVRAGETVNLRYYLHYPAGFLPETTAVFVHFKARRGRPAFQDDFVLKPGMLVRKSTVRVPKDVPAGQYDISVGLYPVGRIIFRDRIPVACTALKTDGNAVILSPPLEVRAATP